MAISAAPGIAQGVAGIVNAAKGRQEEDLGWASLARTAIRAAPDLINAGANAARAAQGREEQEDLLFGALMGLAPSLIKAVPGVMQGVSGIIQASKKRRQQQEDLGFSLGGSIGPVSLGGSW